MTNDTNRPVDDDRLADQDRPLDDTDRRLDDDRDDRPLDDNRAVDDDRTLADSGGVDDGRALDDDRAVDSDRTPDVNSGLDAGRGWQDEPTAADDRTADADRATTNDAMDATPAPAASAEDPLVPTEASVDFKARWAVIQQGFVDDPRAAVTDADKLVSDVLERLSATFDGQHKDLEGQWADGEPSTEDLRSALQKYRAFFERLLTL